jgi:hypothetical protein
MKRSSRRPIGLCRIAESGFARVLARVMALLLVLGNLMAASTPTQAAVDPAATHVMSGATQHHCADAATVQTNMRQNMHGKGCPCCVGASCACFNLSSAAFTAGITDLMPLPPLRLFPAAVATPAELIAPRRLRPPIA